MGVQVYYTQKEEAGAGHDLFWAKFMEARTKSSFLSCKHFSEMAFCEFGEGGLDPCSQLHHFFSFSFYAGALYVYLCTFVGVLSFPGGLAFLVGKIYQNCLIWMSLWRTLK